MSEAYSGGCACGAVRYEISGEPVFMNHCQCLDCQRRSGTGHGSYLTFTGKQGVKLDRQGDALRRRRRQRQCEDAQLLSGLRVAGLSDLCGDAGLFTVHAASLDDPARFKPQAVTYGMRGYAWDHLDPAVPKFDKMPPAGS